MRMIVVRMAVMFVIMFVAMMMVVLFLFFRSADARLVGILFVEAMCGAVVARHQVELCG